MKRTPVIAIMVVFAMLLLAHRGNAASEDAAAAPVTTCNFAAMTAKIDQWVDQGYYPGAGLVVVRNGSRLLDGALLGRL